MPTIDAVIVTAIVTAFVIFAVVLAWAEYQTRHLPQLVARGRAAVGQDRGELEFKSPMNQAHAALH